MCMFIERQIITFLFIRKNKKERVNNSKIHLNYD